MLRSGPDLPPTCAGAARMESRRETVQTVPSTPAGEPTSQRSPAAWAEGLHPVLEPQPGHPIELGRVVRHQREAEGPSMGRDE